MTVDWKDDLTPLFAPRSVALVGASERNDYSRIAIESLERWGFPSERVFIVNRTSPEVYGRPCLPSVEAIPGEIELAVMLVNRGAVAEALRSCAQKGARAAVVLGSGFAEADEEGDRLQAELVEVAEELRLVVCGPNCTGVADFHARVCGWDGAGKLPDTRGGVSLVFQSGGLLNPVLEALGLRAVGLRRLASVGNSAVLGPENFLHYLVRDPETRVIACYIEGVRDVPKLRASLELAANTGKPIIAIWPASSAKGERAVQSHTGSLVSNGRAWEGLLRQYGVVLVDDLDSLVETIALFAHAADHRVDTRMGFASISGGDTSLVCHVAERNGLELPDISPSVRAHIAEALGRPRILGNPLDLQGLVAFRDPSSFYEWLEEFLSEPFSIFGCRPQMSAAPEEGLAGIYADLKAMAEAHGKLLALFSPSVLRWDQAWFPVFDRLGIPFLQDLDRGCAALRRLAEYSRFRAVSREPVSRPESAGSPVLGSKGVLLFEEAQRLLAQYGIPTVPSLLAHSAEDAAEAASQLGFPVVLKVDSRDVLHRSRAGGVKLHLASREQVRSAYEVIIGSVGKALPQAEIHGVLVQPEVQGGLEVLVGLATDHQLGPVVMVGVGGVLTEVVADVAVGLPPLSRADARALIGRLRSASVLLGSDSEACDTGQLVDLLCRISWLAEDLAGTEVEIDLNPVIVLPNGSGVQVVDALVVRGQALGRGLLGPP